MFLAGVLFLNVIIFIFNRLKLICYCRHSHKAFFAKDQETFCPYFFKSVFDITQSDILIIIISNYIYMNELWCVGGRKAGGIFLKSSSIFMLENISQIC